MARMAYQQRRSPGANREMAVTFAAIAAGAALFEAVLLPGILIGGAAVLAPKYLLKLQRHRKSRSNVRAPRQFALAVRVPERPSITPPLAIPARFGVKQAFLKTITFRIIVTTVDFTTNYVVLGELSMAAGLSGVSLVAGPIFYFLHETAWNYFGPYVAHKLGRKGIAIDHSVLRPFQPDSEAPLAGPGGLTISRALAKTITFRAFATVMDFTVNYVVIGELATAVKLSAIGFVVGPFVYLGHERFWDYLGAQPRTVGAQPEGDGGRRYESPLVALGVTA